jgi:signal transduction histidine kinase
MVSHAVPPLAMAAVSAYVGILFAGLYYALAGLTDDEERRDYLTFALTCFAVIAFDCGTARLYCSTSFKEGIVWNRISLCTSGFLGSIYITFVWDFLKRKLGFWLRCMRAFMLLVALPIGLWDSTYAQSSLRPDIKHINLFGDAITYYEAETGPLTAALYGTFFVAYAAATAVMIQHFRTGGGRHQRGRWGFFVGTLVSGAAVTNDVLVGSGVYRSIYLAEYGFTGTILSMGYVLLMRFAELRGRVNTLNRNLSDTNHELVLALGKANESIRLKSEFLASISHELRTPLNAIINLPEAVLEEFAPTRTATCGQCDATFALDPGEELPDDTACPMCGKVALQPQITPALEGRLDGTLRSMKTVVRAGKHLSALVNDLLDASKLELGRTKLHRSLFDCGELLAEVAETVRPIAEPRGITIARRTSATDTLTLSADRVRVGQVLYNLLSNAIKFSHDAGTIEVSVSLVGADELSICVRDFGIGIDPAHHAMVFERFRQVEGGSTRSYGGTGLGLAITKDLVELHGGRIWVDSELGHGAAFFIQLPRGHEQRQTSALPVELQRQSA